MYIAWHHDLMEIASTENPKSKLENFLKSILWKIDFYEIFDSQLKFKDD
jgi:hypothetical protein